MPATGSIRPSRTSDRAGPTITSNDTPASADVDCGTHVVVAVCRVIRGLMCVTVIIVAAGIVTEPMAVIMSPAAEQQDARNVDDQPEHGDRYGFVEPDRNREIGARPPRSRSATIIARMMALVGTREISKFAGAEAEALVTHAGRRS